MRFAIFPLHLPKVLRLPRKSDARWCEVLHLPRKIILANLKIWCSKMQPLSGNQRPDLLTALMNMSCTAPATRNASLHILFKCPTPAIVFGNATKPSLFAHFSQGAQSLAPATQKHAKTTSEPSKWSEHVVLLAFWTWKCASRRNGVHFFDMSTSQTGPSMVCFVHFDLATCFAPQRRALFRHLNFQTWSEKHSVARLSYLFTHLDLLSSGFLFFDLLSSSLLFSDSSHLCFSSDHIVGSLTYKPLSIKI